MSFGGGNSGGGSQVQRVDPYAPAEPALNQIISEAGNLYGQGVKAAGYVAPSQQTITGLAGQELMGTAAQQQLADTLSGKYLNPFYHQCYKVLEQMLQQLLIQSLAVLVERQAVQ